MKEKAEEEVSSWEKSCGSCGCSQDNHRHDEDKAHHSHAEDKAHHKITNKH